jgi:hypothetical protein
MGAVLKLPGEDSAAGRRVAVVHEIDAAPGDYWMVGVVEDELAQVVGSGVAAFEVPEQPSPLGPVLLTEVDGDLLLVEDRDTKKRDVDEDSAPKRRRVRPATPMFPGELLLVPEGTFPAGGGGRFLYGVCDTFATGGRRPSFHGWEVHRSLHCGDREVSEQLAGRRVPVPGREAQCFVVLEGAPPDALPPGACRYEVTMQPPGFPAQSRSLAFTVPPDAMPASSPR